jgi:hypothetical protein
MAQSAPHLSILMQVGIFTSAFHNDRASNRQQMRCRRKHPDQSQVGPYNKRHQRLNTMKADDVQLPPRNLWCILRRSPIHSRYSFSHRPMLMVGDWNIAGAHVLPPEWCNPILEIWAKLFEARKFEA